MATLLAGSTFNGVRLWGGNNGGNTNTILGISAGDNISAASVDNTIVGYIAGKDAENACGNSVMGANAFKAAGGGSPFETNFNVAFGYASMKIIGGNVCYNTAIGTNTMCSANEECFNVAVGHRAMWYTHGQKNTFVGLYAGCGAGSNNADCNVGIGAFSLQSLSNGSCNVAVGHYSLYNVVNGNSNIAIGARTGGNIVGANNTIAIGYKSQTSNNDGHTAAGSSCHTCFRVGANSWTNLSDRRDKSDIETLPNNLGLNFIRNLRPVKFNFDFREGYVDKCGFEYGVKDGTLKQEIESYGFIAQEIETTLSNVQTHFDALNKNEEGNYRLEYENLIAPIIKSLQQTIERLEFLESKV